MSVTMQVKLYRVLQEGKIRPVGSTEESDVDVRVIAATNKNLEEEIAAERFREDLYYRLSVIPIHLPSLRERPEDIPLLTREFLERFAKSMNKKVQSIDPEAMRRLEVYDWPGNVRELENTIERAVALETGSAISVAALPDRIRNHYQQTVAQAHSNGNGNGHSNGVVIPQDGLNLEEHISNMERSYLLAALERSGGVRTRAAELLKMTYRSFRHYAKKYEI
ncbi:MAG: sigma 54-interacting transcriptional regulator, partial [Candidatus Acidiferrales bacterium]